LPLGKIHSDKDGSILNSAKRELYEKTGARYNKLNHVGDMYLKIHMDKILVSDLLIHVFSAICKQKMPVNEVSCWIDKKDLNSIKLIPGVKEIIKATESHDFFFKEMIV
jgi:hypothetical protein